MIGLKTSYEIAYNGMENECRFELYADSAADLQGLTHFDGIKIQMGSECTDISTGDKYLLNGSGAWILQPSQNAFSNVYTKPEIDSMVTAIYQTIMYYHTAQESTDGTITFYTLGGNVGSLTIYGNGQQNGIPSPDDIIMPDFVGTLDEADWTIPITCAGQTVPVYLGQVSTVRRIKKLVLDGTENWYVEGSDIFYSDPITETVRHVPVCSHYAGVYNLSSNNQVSMSESLRINIKTNAVKHTPNDFKSYLAQQYTAGNPVTVWYVLATPTTGIINEPLCKIGDYADELSSEDAGVSIPTVKGSNTLTVDTDLQPSKIIISGER